MQEVYVKHIIYFNDECVIFVKKAKSNLTVKDCIIFSLWYHSEMARQQQFCYSLFHLFNDNNACSSAAWVSKAFPGYLKLHSQPWENRVQM